MKYLLSFCDEYGHVVNPDNGEIALGKITSVAWEEKLTRKFNTLEECRFFAKQWLKKYPHRGCGVSQEGQSVALYSYETFHNT